MHPWLLAAAAGSAPSAGQASWGRVQTAEPFPPGLDGSLRDKTDPKPQSHLGGPSGYMVPRLTGQPQRMLLGRRVQKILRYNAWRMLALTHRTHSIKNGSYNLHQMPSKQSPEHSTALTLILQEGSWATDQHCTSWSSPHGSAITNPNGIHEEASLFPVLTQWVKDPMRHP